VVTSQATTRSMAACAGVAGGEEELAHAGRVGAHRVVADGAGEERSPGGLRHLEDGGGRVVVVAAAVRARAEHAPLGVDRLAQRAGDGGAARVAAERIEEAFAAVGHRDLVGGPAGGSCRVGHGRRGPGGRHRAAELVRGGDQVRHEGEARRRPCRPRRERSGPWAESAWVHRLTGARTPRACWECIRGEHGVPLETAYATDPLGQFVAYMPRWTLTSRVYTTSWDARIHTKGPRSAARIHLARTPGGV
jgi:hypothetical protein